MADFLRLQQLADSALPIGGASHSFGLESATDAGLLDPENLESFLAGYLAEAGTLEAFYCIRSCRLPDPDEVLDDGVLDKWFGWNTELGARKLARESREASRAMGRRFLRLAAQVSASVWLARAAERAERVESGVHLAACFGLAAGVIGIDPEFAAAAYLQQSVTALVSGCQRLMPLGQTRAQEILWNLKPGIAHAAAQASSAIRPPGAFTTLLETLSARHPGLHTRLFMS